MYEIRHLIANLMIVGLVYLLINVISSLNIPVYVSSGNIDIFAVQNYIGIVVPIILLAISSVVIVLMFSSLIMAIIYYITFFAYLSLLSNKTSYSLFSSILLDFSTFYFLAIIILGIILGLTRRTFPDEIILNINKIKINLNITKVILGIVIALISFLLFQYLFHNSLLFIGSFLSLIVYLSISHEMDFPLVLFSWFSIPYLITHSISFSVKDQGIEIGEIEGVLSPTLVNRISQTKLGWKKFSVSKFFINFEKAKNYNTVIIGTSGSGKSTLAKYIILKSNVSYLVFDLHGEYFLENGKRIDMSKASINPLSLNGTSPRQRALEVAYMLRSIFKLGNLQTIDIFNIIMETYLEKGIDENDSKTWVNPSPNFYDVLIYLEKKKKVIDNSQDLSRLSSIEPYIQFLANQILLGNNMDMKEIFEDNIILDFSKVATDELKYILIETILREFLNYLYKRGFSKLWKLVVIDEAPFVLSRETGLKIVERLFAEVRKFGCGIVLISQISENLETILQNSAYIFIFNVIEPTELEYLSKLLGGSDREKITAVYEAIRSLDKAHIITIDGYNRDILLVKLNSLR
ncbi:MAG: ATP-binding protein [Saccharolobus sp.]